MPKGQTMTDEEKVDTSYRACMLLEDGALSAFREAQATAYPQLIILTEYTFLTQEQQFCVETDKDTLSSFTQAIQSFDGAFLALKFVENSTLYQGAENTHPHSKKYNCGTITDKGHHHGFFGRVM